MNAHLRASAAAGVAGVLTAYALRARVVALRSALPLVSEEAPTQWVHVAYEGEWHGHGAGSFAFDGEVFAQILANHKRQSNPVKLDFDHETEYAPPGVATPARGWVHELRVETDAEGKAHLWALVEFGPRAVQFNREGGYRFCSGVFEFGATDRVTGEEVGCYLSSLALTDQPFIDGQKPIRLSRRAALSKGNGHMTFSKEALARALEMLDGDDVSMEQLEAAAQMAVAADGGLDEAPADEPEAPLAEEPAPEEEPEAPLADDMPDDEEEDLPLADGVAAGEASEAPLMDEEPAEEPDALTAAVAPLMEAFGGDVAALAAALSENADAVLSALQGGPAEPAADAPLSASEVNVALSAAKRTAAILGAKVDELEAWKAAREDADADADVDLLVAEGKILDDVRADWKAIRLSDRGRFDKLAASLPQVVPTGTHALSQTPPTEQTPAIDESDPFVIETRRRLSVARVPKAKQDEQIKRRLAARHNDTQARA